MIASGKKTGVEYPFIIQMGDKGDPYHFYGFQTSFGAPVFNTNADGEYTSELAMGGSGGTDFANWLKAQGDAGIISPSITGDIAKQAFLDGKAAYTVTGPWNVAAFRDNKMDVSVLSVPLRRLAGRSALRRRPDVLPERQVRQPGCRQAVLQLPGYPQGPGTDAEARWPRLRDA